MENEILERYFQYKMKQIDIAKELNISKYKVSRVVTKDPRYQKEKELRKEINKKKHQDNTKKYIENIRRERKETIGYEKLKQMHIQASLELSGGRKTINDRAFRNWNSSIYKYNKNTKSYHLKKDIVTGYDVPRKILWK